jgi:hypothetical protein
MAGHTQGRFGEMLRPTISSHASGWKCGLTSFKVAAFVLSRGRP